MWREIGRGNKRTNSPATHKRGSENDVYLAISSRTKTTNALVIGFGEEVAKQCGFAIGDRITVTEEPETGEIMLQLDENGRFTVQPRNGEAGSHLKFSGQYKRSRIQITLHLMESIKVSYQIPAMTADFEADYQQLIIKIPAKFRGAQETPDNVSDPLHVDTTPALNAVSFNFPSWRSKTKS